MTAAGPAGERPAQRRFERGRVHREAARLDVDQHRHRAGPLDRGDGRDRGVRYREDQVAGADAAGAQRQFDRVGAAADADRVRRPEPGAKAGLERLDLATENVLAAGEHARYRGIDLVLLLEIAGARVGLRDRRVIMLTLRTQLPERRGCRRAARLPRGDFTPQYIS